MTILQEILIWLIVFMVVFFCLRPLVRQIHTRGPGCTSAGEGGCRSCPMMAGAVEIAQDEPIPDSNPPF